ncbi:dimethylaniline monooxygenase [N-oxide-forming] 2-like [Mercenaria mercenaria]|uniref:dimethylaniline monooxygenase [N-oxide-forming] 2-like n=1 Tax=Mercenaria mercenaria TaxID=6596 RepID=UPI00234EA73B|nr:dimethylaniline monooxygenase [N-oxide-forming] 2-like [Mercenaria mercenaria]
MCVVVAGPCGMSALWNFADIDGGNEVDVTCYERQSTWGGLWNYSWRTGTDEYGEPCQAGMYKHLWSNGPKECIEFPDYTFQKHLGKAIPLFSPRPVLLDYLEGHWKLKEGLSKCIKFNTVVRHVQYNEAGDTFTLESTNLAANTSSTEKFDYVIVAVGIFNTPHIPGFLGIETFEGRKLHAHNFRDAVEFKGQRLLIICVSYSAEDLALQCLKYGASSVICTWRTKPMGFKWPKGIEEKPLIQKFTGKKAHFKDGTTEEIDVVILCTGYLYSFPFMEDGLRLKSSLSMFPANLYKGSVWLGGGNNKLFYMGTQDQYYTFTMFDVQALWICKYILGKIPNESKSLKEMKESAEKWVKECSKLKNCHDDIDFQTEFIKDLSEDTGFSPDAIKARDLLYTWEHNKDENIATYRDQCFSSIFTGTKSPKHTATWMQAFNDSISAFAKVAEEKSHSQKCS